MIVYKNHIDNFIKCPFYFGKVVLSGKQNTIRLSDMSVNLKKYIIEIACSEMKDGSKMSLSDYRVGYTNRFFSKPSQITRAEKIIPTLNKLFEVFADNKFLAYNLPVDIPIAGTSVIYRDIIDFVLINEDSSKITVVEFEELDNLQDFKNKITYWPHHYIPYTYLANQFKKQIDLEIIDPNEFSIFRGKYQPERYENDIKNFHEIAKSMSSEFLFRNLNACSDCLFKEECM